MPNGANRITMAVIFSMIADTCSARAMTWGAPFSSDEMAVPAKTAKTTICSTSLSAMALKIELGMTWSMKLSSVNDAVDGAVGAASPATACRVMPAPGCSHSTATMPMSSERIDMQRNQPRVLRPMRPTEAASSIWPMPVIRVDRTSGAMIILIRVMKILGSRP
jgi:hypothetical protein